MLRLTVGIRRGGSSLSWPRLRNLHILALESSADDTCAAIINEKRDILANVVRKQHDVHEKFRGIHPLAAIRSHRMNMPGVIRNALDDAHLSLMDIDAFAFTQGPGMSNNLAVSSAVASSFAITLNKPLIGVHHMQAHALTPFISERNNPPQFPFLTLLVSGGHTMVVLAKSWIDFEIIADTVDIAVGSAFDKLAAFMNLSYYKNEATGEVLGAGAALEALASKLPNQPLDLPQELTKEFPVQKLSATANKLEFSFGTAAGFFRNELEQRLLLHRNNTNIPSAYTSTPIRHQYSDQEVDLINEAQKIKAAKRFQEMVCNQIVEKVEMSLDLCEARAEGRESDRVTAVVASGGVASNQYLRGRLQRLIESYNRKMRLVFPPPNLCTDNAVMIANVALHHYQEGNFTTDWLPRRKWRIDEPLPPDETLEKLKKDQEMYNLTH